jgi:abortive infection bacteriophage resistance protein
MTAKSDYPKKVRSFDKQIQQLKDRGLVIKDEDLAKDYLRNISYFRLQGFWWEYQKDKDTHQFQDGWKFI